MKSKILGLLALGLVIGPMVANAVTVGGTYSFSASNLGGGAPVDPVLGSFTVSFDNSANISNSTTGFTLNSINISGGAAGYTYNFANDRLFVGGLLNTVQTLPVAGTNDWVLRIDNFSTSPTFVAFGYSQVGMISTNTGQTGSLAVSSVPEPGTLALLGLGLLGLGVSRRKA